MAQEEDAEFVYLALELCSCTFDQYVQQQSERLRPADPQAYLRSVRSIMYDVVRGVQHLHSLQIVHRDVKPQNVLMDADGKAKISDMGLAKKLDADHASFYSLELGTCGWQAPEMLQPGGRMTSAVDVFSLGCMLYYAVSGGQHPFGGRFERNMRIMEGKPILDPKKVSLAAMDLVESMIQNNPEKRPSLGTVLEHPFFWDEEKGLSFIQDVSDEISKQRESSPVYAEIERGALRLFQGPTWDPRLDPEVYSSASSFKRYDTSLVRELLRCIRNMRVHYREYPAAVQRTISPQMQLPNDILVYFLDERRFPALLMYAYRIVRQHWRRLDEFVRYF